MISTGSFLFHGFTWTCCCWSGCFCRLGKVPVNINLALNDITRQVCNILQLAWTALSPSVYSLSLCVLNLCNGRSLQQPRCHRITLARRVGERQRRPLQGVPKLYKHLMLGRVVHCEIQVAQAAPLLHGVGHSVRHWNALVRETFFERKMLPKKAGVYPATLWLWRPSLAFFLAAVSDLGVCKVWYFLVIIIYINHIAGEHAPLLQHAQPAPACLQCRCLSELCSPMWNCSNPGRLPNWSCNVNRVFINDP